MTSQFRLVFILLVADTIQCGLSIGDMEYGLLQTEKVIKGICWLEKFMETSKNTTETVPDSDCDKNIGFVETFQLTQKQMRIQGGLTVEHENEIISAQLLPNIDKKLTESLPKYTSCAKFSQASPKAPEQKSSIWGRRRQKSVKDFGWLLKDEEVGEYPYRDFAHCLLDVAETQHGEELMIELKIYWGSLKLSEISARAETGQANNTLCMKEVEYCLAQAEKVATVVCWIENTNKTSTENDLEAVFQNCSLTLNETYSVENPQEPNIQNEEKDTNTNSSLKTPIGDAFQKLLPGYTSCAPFLQDVNKLRSKDFGEILEDSKHGEYPYKGYTHCLLEVLEQRYGQPGLDDFKSKWRNLQNSTTLPVEPAVKIQNPPENVPQSLSLLSKLQSINGAKSLNTLSKSPVKNVLKSFIDKTILAAKNVEKYAITCLTKPGRPFWLDIFG